MIREKASQVTCHSLYLGLLGTASLELSEMYGKKKAVLNNAIKVQIVILLALHDEPDIEQIHALFPLSFFMFLA